LKKNFVFIFVRKGAIFMQIPPTHLPVVKEGQIFNWYIVYSLYL